MEVSRDGRPVEYRCGRKTARRSQQLQSRCIPSLAVTVRKTRTVVKLIYGRPME